MTKKNKRIIILISILFIAIYSFSSVQLYELVENEQVSHYYDASRGLSESLYTLDNSKTSNELISYLSSNYYDLDTFAWGVALYNKDCEIVARTGSYIQIAYLGKKKNEFIYIDKYLTSEIKKQISDYIKSFKYKTSYILINELNYIENNGNKIPVSFTISDPNLMYDPIKVILSDEKNYKTLTNHSDESNLFIGFMDIDEESYIHKEFDEVNDYFENFDADKIKSLFLSHSGGGSDSHDGKEYSGYLEFADGAYVVVIRVIFNYRLETLKSLTFRSVMMNQTICYIVFYLIALISLITYFKKNKKHENIKKAFTNAAAHELKTPLAVIENQCECIMENIAPEKNAEYINSIYSEALRMNKLVASFLQYNRLASADNITIEKQKLDGIVNIEIEKYQTYFSTKNISLETEIHENAIIKCNAALLSLVIDNYLSNAIKHTESGKTIRISLLKYNNSYKFSVYNEGAQIPDEYKDMLFNVLYKTDKARSREDNSTGMGLAICKEILDQHKFKYGYSNKRNGVEFYFTT